MPKQKKNKELDTYGYYWDEDENAFAIQYEIFMRKWGLILSLGQHLKSKDYAQKTKEDN